ncbi:hypothetical protein ACIQUY_40215 [Streptomyces sp. NPDC090231]|uniref:hypothetical protein n=1 Tax=unclassified Streptomyces TaxID=2593676 RepID=UPI003816C073
MAVDVLGNYFECSNSRAGGVREKSGRGVWHVRKSMGTSTVFLDFEDKCYATISVGEYKHEIVLWNKTEDDEGDLMIMRLTS